jgi:hypothetical protein
MRINLQVALILIYSLIHTSLLYGQRVDYEAFPELDANYIHLELELEITSVSDIRGDAIYQFRLLRDDVDSLKLDAIRLDFDHVELNGEPADYRVVDDRLIVMLPDEAAEGNDYRLRLQYRANPSFGVFEDQRGNIWSSGLPGSVRHWLPAMDHPRNSLTTDITMIYPGGKHAVISGIPGESSVESVDLQRIRYFTDSEIPISSLRFAIGEFDQARTGVGRHQIYLHSERGLLDEEEKANLLDDAFIAFRHAERTLNVSYPSRALHIVVLEDDKWESKNYGSGIVFAFNSLENLKSQIAFGVTAQWLGIQLREEQWEDATALLVLQSWLHNQSEELQEMNRQPTGRPEFNFEGIYNIFSPENRLSWNTFFQLSGSEAYEQVLNRVAPNLISESRDVINWYDFASHLYQHSGRNFMEIPSPPEPDREITESILVYRVEFNHDEEESRIRLSFTAEGESTEELVSVIAEEYSFNDVRSREITFTGSSDEVILNVNRTIENLKLTVDEDYSIELLVEKPFMFWLNQLQRDEDPESRAAAAVALRDFSDNPDLQLALLDIIDSEENENVYAEAILTLAAVTGGASGTDQLFRQRFSFNLAPVIQKAIAEAYANYENNDAIISQLRNMILNSESAEVKEQAIRSLSSVTDSDRFRTLSEDLLTDERVERHAPLMLRELARSDETTAVVSLASAFIDREYPYRNRVQVFDLLLDYDRSADRWERRINLLSSDSDPRVRLRALDGLQFLSSATRNEIIEERLYEEFDDRILRRLNQLQGM